ncbi:hypothetical protein B0H19DRAFT_541734 [Mycena capillaripes]|nr:hypothetical protein B0H19DRAFT_541734 [Mycena capillaripes]
MQRCESPRLRHPSAPSKLPHFLQSPAQRDRSDSESLFVDRPPSTARRRPPPRLRRTPPTSPPPHRLHPQEGDAARSGSSGSERTNTRTRNSFEPHPGRVSCFLLPRATHNAVERMLRETLNGKFLVRFLSPPLFVYG